MEKCIVCLKDDHPTTLIKLRQKVVLESSKLARKEETVRTDDFESRIQDACDLRNDDWAAEVRGRLESVSDLHAADAVYHQACSVNFRTCKNTPVFRSPISPDAKPENKRGRPALQEDGFYKTVDFLKHHDDEQISISDLVEKMDEMCDGNAYSQMYLKKRLKQHFGDEIIITDIPGRKSVVTLRETVTCILQDYYQRPSNLNPDDEKRALIRAAAKLIKSDIRSVDTKKSIYPTPANIASVDNNLSYLPESLLLFLSNIFSEIDPSVKIASIGQAVMQASRPRALITPLQLGLGVQVHHNFASRFLVSTLNSLGFCSSYYEVQKFESSAAAVQGVDLPGDISNSFVQFVADNVDHNTRTIDGLNTFHGMGIIAGITPGTKRTQPIPRIAFSTDEIKALAKIEIKYYKPQSDRMAELSYAELKNLNTLDKTFRLDLLSVIIWPLKYPIPMWSGFMQMVQTGDYPGKSSVSFLPMIDLNASDMTCIYSTLNFVANQAKRYDITAILTFDQPLYWKALSIVENENPGSTLKSMVLRLGPFHTEMSFLGSIGNLMSNTGLKEMLELIYAPNAVTHILSGKAVARAFRGHMLVDTALYCLLIADIFNIDVSKLLEEPNSTLETTEMKEIDKLYSQLSSGELSASEAGESDVLKNLEATVRRKTEILKQSRTAKLWLQYSEMVQVLRQFIKAERTGNWPLHLQSIQEMLPFLAASGHNLYTKTAYVYLMTMQSLDEDHPDVYANFINGNHVIRRSNRYWAGISSDLFIEQVLMRSVKTAGGLTRGRGMTESQRSLWLMSMPACAEINQAMQDLSGVGYFSSEQHKDETHARQKKDTNDIQTLLTFLKSRNPFIDSEVDRSLRNIETGVVADKTVNDDAKRSQAKHSQNKDLGHNRDKEKNGPLVCNILPFIHAFSGCDTTCRIFGQGKGTVFKKISTNLKLQDHAAVFCQESNVESIHKAGEQMFVALYGGLQDVETLDMLRYRIFASKVCVGNIYVQVHTLPPTSDAAKLHCMRVYHQTQVWIGKGDKLDPKDWGWHVEDNKLLPIRAILPPAPEKLLRIIRCNCKLNCDTKRCSCRKHGIDCSPACGECRGMNCSNTSNITEADELDDM
ncbi:unnamed protein product [Mytilus edulis]|uniref:Tesmin/TSO1-like CXC domain-containing protein n=1 Tax=Mytilus edulis TaxID=6550 RepID=A0A8S3QPX5_MYTED|nr:unnamed protein product [Mytilus edulis]